MEFTRSDNPPPSGNAGVCTTSSSITVKEMVDESITGKLRPEQRFIHRVGRVLSFFSSRRNWDSPNPSLAGERGVWESQFRRGDIHCGRVLFIYTYFVGSTNHLQPPHSLPIHSATRPARQNPRQQSSLLTLLCLPLPTHNQEMLTPHLSQTFQTWGWGGGGGGGYKKMNLSSLELHLLTLLCVLGIYVCMS